MGGCFYSVIAFEQVKEMVMGQSKEILAFGLISLRGSGRSGGRFPPPGTAEPEAGAMFVGGAPGSVTRRGGRRGFRMARKYVFGPGKHKMNMYMCDHGDERGQTRNMLKKKLET